MYGEFFQFWVLFDPAIAPHLNKSLSKGFPPVLIQTAGKKVLLSDSVVMYQVIEDAGQVAGQSLKLGQDSNLPESIGIAHYFLGITYYLRNELEDAGTELSAVVKEHYETNTLNFAHSAFALTLSYQAQGRPEEARKMVESVIGQALDSNSSELLQIAEAFQAELALRQGNIARAKKWAGNFDASPFHPGYRFYVPQLTLAKVFLAQNTPESLQQAADLLSLSHDYYGSIHNTRYLIDVLILQGLLYDAVGEESSAFEKISKALTLAEPGRLIRPFLDPGPPIADLLNRFAKQNIHVKYVAKLLAAFRKEGAAEAKLLPDVQNVAPSFAGEVLLDKSLSKGELDILALLTRRLSNKEIAEQLFISPETVKRHVYNIYQKLNVSTRREAADKDRMLGIL